LAIAALLRVVIQVKHHHRYSFSFDHTPHLSTFPTTHKDLWRFVLS
jgi:hypothetical protein